jgi:hypothetical protein
MQRDSFSDVGRHAFQIEIDQRQRRCAGAVAEVILRARDQVWTISAVQLARGHDFDFFGKAWSQTTECDRLMRAEPLKQLGKFVHVTEPSARVAARHRACAAVAHEVLVIGERDPLGERPADFGDDGNLGERRTACHELPLIRRHNTVAGPVKPRTERSLLASNDADRPDWKITRAGCASQLLWPIDIEGPPFSGPRCWQERAAVLCLGRTCWFLRAPGPRLRNSAAGVFQG